MVNPFRGYQGGKTMPLGAYATIFSAYSALMLTFLRSNTRHRRRPQPTTGDLVLFGIATHQISRTIAKDWVTAPIRAPFTRYDKNLGRGEDTELPRGHGLQRAIGDLLTCDYCLSSWVGSAMVASMTVWPRATRLFAQVMAVVALSNVLHRFDEGLTARTDSLQAREAAEEAFAKQAA